jgi:tRNA 2-thiocytidine biosynthesis protein TtcA
MNMAHLTEHPIALPTRKANTKTGAKAGTKTSTEQNKLFKRLRRQMGQAIEDYRMIQHGDRVMVCLSGGKDSWTMLDLLLSLQQKAPVDFEIVAVNLDQKQPGFDDSIIPEHCAKMGVKFMPLVQDTYSVVTRVVPEGKTLCSLCSRLRRGALYNFAEKQGFTKIALGHHRDDILATFFMNLFHGGKLAAMPPKLKSDDGKHIVIRPLAYCVEDDIIQYAKHKAFPIIPCNLCGSQENLQRKVVGKMMDDWQKAFPGRLETMFTALQNVAPSQLADKHLFDFAALDQAPPLSWLVNPVESVE